MSQENSTITNVIDNAAITRYKHKLDAKFPIKERDLQNPSYASLLGCVCTKFLLMLVVALYLLLHTMGFDGSTAMPDALSAKMILMDLGVGWGAFGLASGFTYFYVRVKNPTIGFILFAILIAMCIAEFFIWDIAIKLNLSMALPIIVIAICIIPFVMDIWGIITYDRRQQNLQAK